MKKTLITILIIVILTALGYFAYTKGLINFDFLKKGGSEEIVEPHTSIEEKVDLKLLGVSFTLPLNWKFEKKSETEAIMINPDSSSRFAISISKCETEDLKLCFGSQVSGSWEKINGGQIGYSVSTAGMASFALTLSGGAYDVGISMGDEVSDAGPDISETDYKILDSIIRTAKFDATNIKDTKAVLSEPIHPLCFGSNFDIHSDIDIEKCNKEEQKHPSKDDNGRMGASYSPFEDETSNDNEYGYTSYRILSQKDNTMVIAFIDNPGGSSTTTAILIYEKNGNILKLKNKVHDGDNDIRMWDSDSKVINFSVDLSGSDLLEITYPEISKEGLELGFLEWHFPWYAKANYIYDIATQKNKLVSVVFANERDAAKVENNSECFQTIYHSYIPKGKDDAELTPAQVNEFNKKYIDNCVKSALEGEWTVDGFTDGDNTANEWMGKTLRINYSTLSFDFNTIPSMKNKAKENSCTILNLYNPDKSKDFAGDSILKYKTNCKNHPFSEFYLDNKGDLAFYWATNPMTGWEGVLFYAYRK